MGLATFLDARPPTQLRGLAWLSLSETVIVQSEAFTSDSGGGASATWSTAGTFPGRVAPLFNRPMTRIVGGAIDERSTHVVTTPLGSTINPTDRLVIVGRGTFEVTGVRERTSAYTNVCEVMQVS